MKVQLFTILVATIAFANLIYKPSADIQAAPDPIDFASLHTQAATALQQLQSAQEHRVAGQQTSTATF